MTTRLYGDVLPDNDQTRARQEHFRDITKLVGAPYPNRFDRSRVTKGDEGEDTITSVVSQFKRHQPKPEPGEKPTPEQLETANAALSEVGKVRISGRLATPPRVMGKAAFVHLSDGKERLQIYVRKQEAVAVSNDSLRPVEERESGWKLFQLLDHGDFVGVEGRLFVTKTGELSVHVETIQFLSKALLPMPDKMHGINDPEIRQRQRYADLIASSLKVKTDEDGDSQQGLSTREVFERRSKLITAMRRHLDDHGYVEVETPMLSPIASGAAARPFTTHHNALDIDLYLRIAPELYLKRLLVGGFERVYELNRNFRNEGVSTRHNPEFTMLEFYTAYKDVNWMMDFCEEMIKATIKAVNDSNTLNFAEHELDFGSFRRLSMKEAIAEHWPKDIRNSGGTDISAVTFDDPVKVESAYWFLNETEKAVNNAIEGQREHALEDYRKGNASGAGRFASFKTAEEYAESSYPAWYARNGVVTEEYNNVRWSKAEKRAADLWSKKPFSAEHTARQIVEMFERLAESHLIQPTFITDFPKVVSPLSKASPDDSAIAERFELYVMGMEVANGFSELNDPAEQLERFEEQARQREGGDEEAMQTDLDYVRALSYGMPPAAGIGIGVDRLTMLLTNRRSIRDVILFPHMRPQKAHAEEAEGDEGPRGSDAPAGDP